MEEEKEDEEKNTTQVNGFLSDINDVTVFIDNKYYMYEYQAFLFLKKGKKKSNVN